MVPVTHVSSEDLSDFGETKNGLSIDSDQSIHSSTGKDNFFLSLLGFIPEGEVARFLNLLIELDICDRRPRPKTKATKKVVTQVKESKHPYSDSDIKNEIISIPGAEKISIIFDSKSNLVEEDKIIFKKSRTDKKTYGEYTLMTFPGINEANSELVIESDSTYFEFTVHDDDSRTQWGK